MTNMKLGTLVLVPALLFSTQVNADTLKKSDTVSVDYQAGKLDLRAKLLSLATFKADFEQTVKSKEGELLQSATGNLLLQKPNMLIWNNVEPEEMTIQSDGKTLWHFDPFIEQVSVYNIDSAIANTPILLLSSTDDELWARYQVSKMSNQEYVIYNHQPDAQVKSLSLVFNDDNDDTVLSSFTLIDSTSQASSFVLQNFEQVSPLAPTSFVFNVPEGVDIDDQR